MRIMENRWINDFFKNKVTILSVTLIILYISFSLYPYLNCGFYADDSLNSQVYLYAKSQGLSVFEFALQINRNWMTGVGRFYPVAWILCYGFHGIFQNLILSRVFHVAFIEMNIGLMVFLVYRWSRSWSLVFLFVTLLCSSFQIRSFFDPMSGYAPFLQLVFLFGIGSVGFFLNFLNRNKLGSLIASAVFYCAGLLTYELSLIFFPILFYLGLQKTGNFKKTLKGVFPHFLVTIFYLSFLVYLRLNRGSSYPGTDIGFNGVRFIGSYFAQLTSALPLSYFLSQPSLSYDVFKHFGIHSISTKLATTLGVLLFYLGLRGVQKSSDTLLSPHYRGLGYSLFFLPPFIVAASARWQNSVAMGVGYLPVYLSYYGVAILASCCFVWILKSEDFKSLNFLIQEALRLVFCFAIGTIVFVNHSLNQWVTEKNNEGYKYPRSLIQRAYVSGLVDQIEPNSTVLTPLNYQWNRPELSKKTYLRIKEVVGLGDARDWLLQHQASPQSLYYLGSREFDKSPEHEGWVFWCRVQSNFETKKKLFSFEGVKIYLDSLNANGLKIKISCKGSSQVQFVLVPFSSISGGRGTIARLNNFKCSLEDVVIQ